MIIETANLARLLANRGQLDRPRHPSLGTVGKATVLVVRLSANGTVAGIRFVGPDESAMIPVVLSDRNGIRTPAVKFAGATTGTVPDFERGTTPAAAFATLCGYLPSEPSDNMVKSVEAMLTFCGGLRQVMDGTRFGAVINALRTTDSPEFLCADILRAMRMHDGASKNATDWLREYLSPESKKATVAFETDAAFVGDQTIVPEISDACYRAFGERIPDRFGVVATGKGIVDVIDGSTGERADLYPVISLPRIGNIRLYGRSDKTKTTSVLRHNQTDYPPVTTSTANRLSAALQWVMSPQNEGRYWRTLTPDLALAVIPGWPEKTGVPELYWTANPETTARSAYAAKQEATRLLASMEGAFSSHTGEGVRLLWFRKIDKGNARMDGFAQVSAADLLAAMKRWHGDLPCPGIRIRFFVPRDKKEKRAKPEIDTMPLAAVRLGLEQAVEILDTRWNRSGDASRSYLANHQSIYDAILGNNPSELKRIAPIFANNSLPLLALSAKAMNAGRIAPQPVALMRILRIFNFIAPETMNETSLAFKVGRTLALLDSLHRAYSTNSGGNPPGALVGGEYLNPMLTSPSVAYPQLLHRALFLLTWTRNPSGPKAGLAVWHGRHLGEVMGEVQVLPTTWTEIEKVQLVTGYMAPIGSESSEAAPPDIESKD